MSPLLSRYRSGRAPYFCHRPKNAAQTHRSSTQRNTRVSLVGVAGRGRRIDHAARRISQLCSAQNRLEGHEIVAPSCVGTACSRSPSSTSSPGQKACRLLNCRCVCWPATCVAARDRDQPVVEGNNSQIGQAKRTRGDGSAKLSQLY
jgi:hypothetical protein